MKMDDIARLANVSKAAVSIALNNRPGVSDETRQRILEIAKQNNYVPSRRSRKSAAKPVIHFISISTDTVAVNRPTDLPFFANLLAEISVVTQAQNTSLQIESLSPAQISAWVASVDEDDSNYFGTMVLATALSKSDVLTFTRTLKKVLILDADFRDLAVNAVAIDNFLGGYRAASGILDRGYTDIGYIQAAENYPNFRERQNGFLQRLKEANIKPSLVKKVPSMSLDHSETDTELIRSQLPSVLFCDNDYIAIRIIRAAQQNGIRIPQDLAVMGFDDIAESRVVTPELTTIHVPVHTIATLAINRLTELSEGHYIQYTVKSLVEPTFINRQTL